MTRFINRLTGTEMLVADDRKKEYIAAGHRLAAVPVAKKAETVHEEPIKAPVKRPAAAKKK